MEYSHSWAPLADLPTGYEQWTDSGLLHLAELWQEQHGRLKNSKGLNDFLERLNRKWAIETGILENIYSLDRGVTVLLVNAGFDASLLSHNDSNIPPQDLIGIISAHKDSLDNLFSFVTGDRQFSVNYMCELHQQLLAKQEMVTAKDQMGNIFDRPILKGAFKRLPNNPMIEGEGLHEYCPPEQVTSQMDQLVSMHLEHEEKKVAPEISAAWLHHRFTQIHPFEDGNGRVARAIASLVFIKAGLFPLLITRDERKRYLDALAQADHGQLQPLINLFASVQRRNLRQAFSVSEEVLSGRHTVSSLIRAASDQIFARRQAELNQQKRDADNIVARLVDLAHSRLRSVAEEIVQAMNGIQVDFSARPDYCSVGGERCHYFKRQIIAIAHEFEYFADLRSSTAWASLTMKSPDKTRLIFSFHGVGQHFSGMLACIAFLEQESSDTDDRSELSGFGPARRVVEEPFQFSCLSSLDDVRTPFEQWLNGAIVVALELWRKQL